MSPGRIFPIFLVGMLLLGSGCVNDLESIKRITFRPDDPDQKTSNLELTYTDSGYAKVRLYARLAENFSKPEEVIKFKDGVKVEFYDEDGSVASILTALYGEINEASGQMLVRDSVQLFNPKKNKRLETEELFWNRGDSTIYTDKMVMVRTAKSLLFGRGIRTRQDFSSYVFLKPEGTIDINETE